MRSFGFSPAAIAAAIEDERVRRGWSRSETARRSGVDASQVSRICRGQFATTSQNLVQICNTLDIDLHHLKGGHIDHARRITRAILGFWDKTPADAERILRLIGDLRALRAVSGAGSGNPSPIEDLE